MILEMKTNKIVIVSADPMDAEYLDSLFADLVHIEKKTNLVQCGFCVTEEKIVCIELTKLSSGEKHD